MMYGCPDHPDIEWCERTGYPSFAQPEEHFCEVCGEKLEDEYEDCVHNYLCKDCLLSLHERRWW